MRYEDASQTGSMTSDVNALDDTEHLAGNDFGPATGNLITGSGTVSGATGTDMVGAGGHITAITGAGGSDTTFDADGNLEVAGQYGTLKIDAEGNYTYVRNPDSPEGVSDTFTYTLANEAGATDSAKLVIAIGNLPILQAQGTQTILQNGNVVVLPPGVELSDVRVVGRDLVITLPDGSTMIIPDGAVFVPQLVINGVEVPASNLAALLIDAEPRPAAGDISPTQLSSGGNFALPPPPLDPGVPLGDLLPPTELFFTPPEVDELFDTFDNDPPVITPSAINVSDEGVSSVNAPIPDSSGSPDTTNERIVNGHVTVVDDDGDSVTITLGAPSNALTSQGVAITWSVSPDGHTVIGSAGGTEVIRIVIENDGDYTVTQSRPVDHPNTSIEDGVSFVIPVFATDGEEAAAPSTITVTIEDDSPVVSNVTVQGGVTLDETTAGSPAGFPISGTTAGPIIANSSGGFGADGPAAANATVFGIGLTGGVSSLASGLQTAQGDFPITLVQIDSDTIQGQYTSGGTQVAFTIQMNGDGSVTLTQNVPLEHLVDGPPGPAHDDSLNLAGLVNATVRLTDRDGDSAIGSAPIGGNLIFKDDGPDASVNTGATLDTIVLDETRPEGTDTAGGGAPSGDASATANFADNFNGPADFGADGAGTVTYQLLLSANGIASGLFALQPADTSAGDGDGIGQGASITLSQAGNVITGSAGGVNYFTISIDSGTGVVTFTQLAPIWHPTPGASFDEAAGLNTAAAANLQVQQTVTDSDGDTDTAAINIGQGVFSIQDDGPNAAVDLAASLDTVVLDETRPEGTDTAGGGAPSGDASATANFADNFVAGGDFGEDGPGSVTYQLLLSANGIGSGLFALQPADTSAGDGDGIGQGAEITLSQVGNTITGSAGGVDYFTISIDSNTGIVTFTQLAPIWHPTPGSSFDEAAVLNTDAAADIQVQQSITDADGDTDTALLNIGQAVFSIQDDGPNADVNGSATLDTIVLDETRPEGTDTAGAGAPTGDASATANFADNFAGPTDFGEDGPGSVTYSLLLSANGIASGLFALQPADTSAGDGDGIGQGASITLTANSSTLITGSAGGVDYFTISINSSTGVVTFTQLAPIWHPTPGASFDEAANLSTTLASNMQVVQTVTDADGDVDTASVNIGQGVFSIQDDGPDAQTNGQGVGTVTLDETRPEGTDTAGGGAPNGDISNTINLAAGFVSGGAVDHGADGPGAVTYSLVLSANGIGSGMFAIDPNDTSAGDGDGIGRGTEITLSLAGNTVTGSANGVNYFTITIDPVTGIATFTQLDNIWHPTPGASYDEAAILNTALASNFQVVQTVTDADGDVDTASIDIGQGVFQIQDDGPAASPDTDTVAGVNGTATGNVITDLAAGDAGDTDTGADDIGEDTPGRVSLIDNGAAPGGPLVVPAGGSVSIAGLFGTLEIFSNGNYTYTRSGSLGGGQNDAFTYTLIDADGDTITSTLTISIADAIPVAGSGSAAVDDDGLAGANTSLNPNDINANTFPNPDDLDGPASSEATFRGMLTVTGGDAPITFSLIAPGAGIVVGQETVTISGTASLLTATITASPDADRIGDPLFTVSLNQATGEYVVTLVDNILHGDDANNDEDGTEVSVNISFQVSDNDADPSAVPGTLTIVFNDDVPDAQVNGSASLDTIVLDETRPEGTDTAGGGAPTGDASATANFADNFAGPVAYGADGPGSTVYSLFLSANGIASGLFALQPADTSAGDGDGIGQGASITLTANSSTLITGSAGGVDYFTISIDSGTGVVTFTQLAPIWHPTPGSSFDEAANLSTTLASNMQVVQTVTDADGDVDTASVNIGQGVFSIQDDGPDASVNGSASLDTIVLDETRPEGTDTGPGNGAPTGDASATADFSDNFNGPADHGADGPGSVTYTLLLSANGIASGLFALQASDNSAAGVDGDGIGQGASITLSQTGNTITGSAGGVDYFTISINSGTGVVTFTQLQPIWHPTPGAASFDEAANLSTTLASNIQVVQTISDADGDVDTASINIGQGVFSIQDDGPSPINAQDPLEIENTGPTPTGSGTFVLDVGADVNSDFDDISVSGFTVSVNGTPIVMPPGGLVAGVEDANAANYTFSFDYDTGTGGTDTATGTLVFHKTGPEAGTYEVTLTSGPVAGFTTVGTGSASTSFDEYDLNGGAPEVIVAALDTNLFAQFTAFSRGSSPPPNLQTDDNNPATPPAPNNAWIEGEVFTSAVANPQASNSDAGVNGNTMDSGEVLDFDLFTADPGSDLTAVPDATAGTMFMQFFQFAGDDIIVILKLQDADNPSITTTKAILIDAGDLFTNADAADAQLDGTPWEAMVAALGNQDALLVIEPNDYNDGNDNWVIAGAQILTDDDLVTGTGLNFNGDIGATGGTDRNGDGVFADVDAPPPGPGGADFDEVQSFSEDTDVSGVKITNIGFLVPSTEDQQVIIEFDVTVTDADGDSVTQNDVTVIIGDAPAETLLATSSSEKGGPAIQEELSSSSLLVSDTQTVERIAANSNSVTLAAAVAAAGIAASSSAAAKSTIAVQDDLSAISAVSQSSFQDLGGVETAGRFSALSAFHDSGFDWGAMSLASTSHTAIMASNIGELNVNLSIGSGPNALLEATDMGAMLQMSAPAMAMDVAMPNFESLMPQVAGVDAQMSAKLGLIVQDALQGGGTDPSIDALLSGLPGAGLGENAGLQGLATQIGDNVPAWDMGHAGGFTFDAASIITSEAMVLHHDAVQPVANG